MDKRQLRVLFVWYLFAWIIASGLLSLLPVHARNLGAAAGVVGYFMAFAYVMIATGSLVAGWLCRRLGSRRACVIAATTGVPLGAAGMAWAADIWQLAVATGLVWLSFGLMVVPANTLIGLRAKRSERGRVFGIIGMTQGLGKILSGVTLGPAADLWGYRGMFLLTAAFGVAALGVSLTIRDVEAAEPKQTRERAAESTGLGWRYWAFLGAIVLMAMSTFAGNIARALVMQDAGFAATAIASVAAIGGLMVLAVKPTAGWLSDRLGRHGVIVSAFVAGSVSLLAMSFSTALWHFWVAMLLRDLTTARQPAQKALVADTLPPEAMDRGMAYLAASGWVGGIIGYGVAGSGVQALGGRVTMQAAAVLPLLGIGLLVASGLARPASAVHGREEPSQVTTGSS